MYIKMIHSAIN